MEEAEDDTEVEGTEKEEIESQDEVLGKEGESGVKREGEGEGEDKEIKLPPHVLDLQNASSNQLESMQSEMDWFRFENRVRKLIFETVEPITTRLETFDHRMGKFKADLSIFNSTQKEFNYTINKLGNKVETLLELRARMDEFETTFKKAEQKNKLKIDDITQKIEGLKMKLRNLGLDFVNLGKLQRNCEDDIESNKVRTEAIKDQCFAQILTLKHEVNQTVLQVKIDSRTIQEVTAQHQIILENYKEDMKKHDMKVEECANKTEEVSKFFSRFDETVSYKAEINPVIKELKRSLQNLLVSYKTERIEKEKEQNFDSSEQDIFVNEEPVYSTTNRNILAYLKSVYYPIQFITEREQLEKLKEEIQNKMDKFCDTPLFCEEEAKRKLEGAQKRKFVDNLRALLKTEIRKEDNQMWDILSRKSKNGSVSKTQWKMIGKNLAKNINKPDKIHKTVMKAYKMGVQRTKSKRFKNKSKAYLRANSRKYKDNIEELDVRKIGRMMPKSPLLERKRLSSKIISQGSQEQEDSEDKKNDTKMDSLLSQTQIAPKPNGDSNSFLRKIINIRNVTQIKENLKKEKEEKEKVDKQRDKLKEQAPLVKIIKEESKANEQQKKVMNTLKIEENRSRKKSFLTRSKMLSPKIFDEEMNLKIDLKNNYNSGSNMTNLGSPVISKRNLGEIERLDKDHHLNASFMTSQEELGSEVESLQEQSESSYDYDESESEKIKLDDLHEEVTLKIEDLTKQQEGLTKTLEEVKQSVTKFDGTMDKKIKDSLEFFRVFKKEILQRMELLSIDVKDRLDQEVKYRKRDITDSRMIVNGLKKMVEKVQIEIKDAIIDNDDIRKTMKVLVKDIQIQHAMETIDEVDRRSIALYGVNSTTSTSGTTGIKKKVISIDKQCLNCSPQPTTVIKAFKMACLTYKSSNVFWEGKEYSREEMGRMRQCLLNYINRDDKDEIFKMLPSLAKIPIKQKESRGIKMTETARKIISPDPVYKIPLEYKAPSTGRRNLVKNTPKMSTADTKNPKRFKNKTVDLRNTRFLVKSHRSPKPMNNKPNITSSQVSDIMTIRIDNTKKIITDKI
ncbi:unnamed protein product [Moneuplotes crassus]|uniref:Uncharacterized protein n=1 Tax=Euplotes crassus TaxID=5936 RepID=A0AAD1UKH5_EUPCR|nr:unnamed protein product [Moneuplotes crassus]